MYEEGNYKERGEEKPWVKVLLIAIAIIVIVLLIIFGIKACSNKGDDNLDRGLLEAGKEHYRLNNLDLPSAAGECKIVTLGNLLEEKLIANTTDYTKCNNDKTYVKVCLLESGSYHYVPVLQCGTTLADKNFTEWKDGSESDIIADKTDVRFTFLGEKLEINESDLDVEKEGWLDEIANTSYKTINTTKYYRYRDKTWRWSINTKNYYPGNATSADKISTYYTEAPESGYTNKDNANGAASKWYKQVFANGTSTSSISGYPEKGDSTEVFKSSTTTNATARYQCVESQGSTFPKVSSDKPCEQRTDGYTYQLSVSYSCATGTLSEGTIKCCASGTYNDSKGSCGTTTTEYKWYKRAYYPSGSTSASGENTYYVSSPTSGAIKDESTITTAYKFYKDVSTTSGYSTSAPSNGATKSGDYKWSEWSDYQVTAPKTYTDTREIETRISVKYRTITNSTGEKWTAVTDGYVSETDLISAFQNSKYNVNSLEDIKNSSDIRYQLKLQYRNKK